MHSSPVIVNGHISSDTAALWTVIYMLVKADSVDQKKQGRAKAKAFQQLCPCWVLTRAGPV